MTGTRSWVLAGMLAYCAAAAADVRVFVTSSASGYGLDLLGPDGDGTGTDPMHENWPIDPFRPTYSTVDAYGHNDYAYDYHFGYYRVGAYPPIAAPSGTVDNPILINAAAGEWAYIWFQFRNEPKNAVLNGLGVQISEADSAAPTSDIVPTYYVQNNRDGDFPDYKRWDGYASPDDGYAAWHNNPQTMVANNTRGIVNLFDEPVNMFQNQAVNGSYWTGVTLLGALTGAPSDKVYELRVTQSGYAAPPYPTVGASCYFSIVPEPGGVSLLGILVAALRRRQH